MMQQRQQHSCKRQREHDDAEDEHQQQQPLFLYTHLSLLRALHADDATEAGGDLADASCPRPSWVEINNFLVLQASLMTRQTKARRTKAILRTVSPTTTTTTTTTTTPATSSPLSRAATLPTGTAQHQRQRGSGIEQSRPLLDPRAVVTAVLRNAVRSREAEHVSASAGLRGLRKGVDDTVDHLASSLDSLRRSRRDRAKPWSNSQEGGDQAAHAADVVERHQSKLLLWRRLQRALAASRVGVDEGLRPTVKCR